VKALITGGGGQLASDLAELLGPAARSFSRQDLDITDLAAVERTLEAEQPDVVFNCGAFHNLELCEAQPERAWAVNVDAVRELARRCPRLVHISTNYVFDGEAAAPYAENDLPGPQSVYALTKLAGEYAALAYGGKVLVVRTAGLYGLNGSASKGGNFVQRITARARGQEALSMVADQRLQPTFTRDLAQALVAAADQDAEGVVHLTASGECSWYEFTVAILERARIPATVEPMPTKVNPGGVKRPLNGVLARPRADALGLPVLRGWGEALDDYMSQVGLKRAEVPTAEV
jgi:dTDP-4-dehydrorhamnose reductase